MKIRLNFNNKLATNSSEPLKQDIQIETTTHSVARNKYLSSKEDKKVKATKAQALATEKPNNRAIFEQLIQDLNKLIGLDNVKKFILELYAFLEIQKRRSKENLATEPLVLHMIFKGNPGTGKTTVARIFGNLFKELGVLTKGHIIEVERADLVGEYIGHTAQRTREQIKKALGGILFIDEAYSLARGGEKDFGKEAIDVLVKAMEDHKNNLILILAGYKDEMDWFLKTNPGLRSRLPLHIEFPDYSVTELLDIAKAMAKERQYFFSPEAYSELEKILRRKAFLGHCKHGNARLVRNILEKSIRLQAARLITQKTITREDLLVLQKEDIKDIDESLLCDYKPDPDYESAVN
ncbi:MAG: AAA family ATPase [Zhaonellaceae bacterium]|jgi:stage V sporulation protein K|nr:AAA family ATPase [Clostridia bacterium]